MNYLRIKPDIPPEIRQYLHAESALENPNCIDFLRKVGVSKGTLICWTPKETESGGKERKNSSIYIPPNFTRKVVIIKSLNELEKVDDIIIQSSKQVSDLDRFLDSLGEQQNIRISLPVYFLFVVNEKQKSENLVAETIESIKNRITSTCQSISLKRIHLEIGHIYKIGPRNNIDKGNKKKFLEILDECQVPEDVETIENPLIRYLVDSVPEFKYLEISNRKYNCNQFENSSGFHLHDAEAVSSLLVKFFDPRLNKLNILPDMDLSENHILNRTTENGYLNVSHTNDFTGEQLDFCEKLLQKLKNPKGLLIRSFAALELNAVLKSHYSLNFQWDWIFCSHEGIYGIEISRSDNLQNPKLTVERKFTSVLSTSMPKLHLVLASFLEKSSESLEVGQRKIFFAKHFKFIIYFTNISMPDIRSIVNTSQTKSKKIWNILEKTPIEVLEQVFIMGLEDATFDKNLPDLYKIVKRTEESTWTLEKSELSVRQIFSDSKTGSANHDCSYPESVSNSDAKTLQYLTGLLSFGFLAFNFCIHEPKTGPLKLDQKISPKVDPDNCNIILSPQQTRILRENKRFVFLVGEPGSGKTSILFAKALDAARDPLIDHIIFVYPNTKTEFKKVLDKFVCLAFWSCFRDKIFITKISDLKKFLRQFDLSRSVLLADEFYTDSDEEYSKSDSFLIGVTGLLSWYPKLRQCWLTKTEAGQNSRMKVYRVTLPHFQTETLNVLFRCSWHIGKFCTTVLHQSKSISNSTAWVFGCNKSSQNNVYHNFYHDLKSLNQEINTCQELRTKFADDRITVVFTIGSSSDWTKYLAESRHIVGTIFVANERMGFYDVQFTGIEKNSVLIIIDYCSENRIDHNLKLFTLAASRAQFELCFMIRKTEEAKLKPLLRLLNPTVQDEIILSARLGLPLELDKLLSGTQDPQERIQQGNELLWVAIQRQNKDLVRAIAKKLQPNQIDIGKLFVTLDSAKTDEFLEVVEEFMGPTLKWKFEKIRICSVLPAGRQWVTLAIGETFVFESI